MADVALTLFGPPYAGTHGRPHLPVAAKSLGLLAYLALEAHPHSRESLATLFWSESDEESARASLRQALKHLRATFGEAIVADRQQVSLSGTVACDVSAFLEAARRSSRDAVRFDVDRFFEGFPFRGAPLFEEWVAGTRQRLLRLYHTALHEECRHAVARSRWREGLELAERWCASDPLSEEAMCVMVQAVFCVSGRAEALARHRRYCDLLKREIGARPGEALSDLARRIEASPGPVEAPDEADAEAAPLTFDTDLIGRESHWVALTSAWAGLADQHARVVLLEGESGMGKTRLADEFARWAVSRGGTVLRGRAYEPAGGVPFGPIATALRGALGAPGLAGTDPEWLSEVSRLIPELHRRFAGLPSAEPPSAAGERWRLFEGVAQVLLSLAADHPVVLFIDDLHWCDVESCALIQFLLQRLDDAPFLFIATVTTGELEQCPAALQLVQTIASWPRARAIPVQALSQDEVWQLVRQMGNIRTPTGARRFAARLHEVSDGNAFQVIEIVKMLFAEGLLGVTPISREWVVSAEISASQFGRVEMPRSVRDAIRKRITRLPYELRDVAATIAVAGRPVGIEVLSHIHGMSRLRLAALTEALIERHLVEEGEGAYRMAHPLLGAVVRAELTTSRRRELHRAMSLALQLGSRAERLADRAGEIAWHAERGGDGARAYRFALMASDQAVQHCGFDEALSWLELARRAAPDERGEIEGRMEKLAMLAGTQTSPRPAGLEPVVTIAGNDVDLRVAGQNAGVPAGAGG